MAHKNGHVAKIKLINGEKVAFILLLMFTAAVGDRNGGAACMSGQAGVDGWL